MRFFNDLNASAFTAGFVAVLVGFTSSVAIVFQAALAFNATPAQIASLMWALGIGHWHGAVYRAAFAVLQKTHHGGLVYAWRCGAGYGRPSR